MSYVRRRNPQREEFWRKTLAAWEKSGQSVRAFCAGRGLSEPSFYAWRRTLRERNPHPKAAPRALNFVPLRVVPDAVLEVVLPAGLVARVPAGADAVVVAALVTALGSASC